MRHLIIIITAVFLCLQVVSTSVAEEPVISEIVVQRQHGLGVGPVDRLILRSDGAAEYRGTRKVEQIGEFRGRVSPEAFDGLVRLVRAAKFFELEPLYRGTVTGTNRPVTDAPGITLSVTCDGKTTAVADYGAAGPERLRALQRTILDQIKTISWRKQDEVTK
jgi:hypothetical protein